MLQRRDFLRAALGGVATGTSGAIKEAAADPAQVSSPSRAPAAEPPMRFDRAQVLDAAAALAKTPFKSPSSPLPNVFANLNYQQYVAIANRPSSRIWANENVGFALEPLHRGFIFTEPMIINIVENGVARRLAYSENDFDFGSLKIPETMPDIGFSGFRALRLQPPAPAAEIAVFQGASFFRAIAEGQNFGVMARGLSVRTGDPKGEEFPIFREVWIEKPSLATNALVIHALLDSASVAGAYQFILRPGEVTIIDTECTLFPRVEVKNYGLAGMAGTSFLSPLSPHAADVRPRVYDFSGLRMLTGKGEWIWRPVTNRETLQISSFLDNNPTGFGFLQQHRNFQDFLDDDQHWELRPSLWIEPIGDWGRGSVDLVEIPSQSEINQNAIAYWRPAAPLSPTVSSSYAYRQFWCWTPPRRPKLATVSISRSGKPKPSSPASQRRFLIEFKGDVFSDPNLQAPLANVTASEGKLSPIRSFLSQSSKTFRVLFDLDIGNKSGAELRLVVTSAGKTITETWLYRWAT